MTLLMRSSPIRAPAILASVVGAMAPLLVPGAARADETPPLTVLRPEPTAVPVEISPPPGAPSPQARRSTPGTPSTLSTPSTPGTPSTPSTPDTTLALNPTNTANTAVTPTATTGLLKLTPLGYVEALYAYNFNRPSNGITNFRGFDNRHNAFTLSNVAFGANAEVGPVTARIILQYGSTPSSYYASEPAFAGSGGANGTGPELWKYLQEANVAWKAPVGRGLLLQIGLVPSPIGYETFAVKDNWNWSRSNLFFGFPFYHTGLRATYEWTNELSTTVSVFNGWNSVVDNNEQKSVQATVAYKVPDKVLVQALYFGGVERPTGAPEGPYWRHHFDVFGQYDATKWLSLTGQADYGFEKNRIGTASWWAGAVYARVRPVEKVYVALRGDRFTENLATDGAGRVSNALFWGGVEWVSSFTATLDVRPVDNLSIRLEYRHDVAQAPLYFGRNVAGDGSAATPYIPNARTQDTALLGATAWF